MATLDLSQETDLYLKIDTLLNEINKLSTTINDQLEIQNLCISNCNKLKENYLISIANMNPEFSQKNLK